MSILTSLFWLSGVMSRYNVITRSHESVNWKFQHKRFVRLFYWKVWLWRFDYLPFLTQDRPYTGCWQGLKSRTTAHTHTKCDVKQAKALRTVIHYQLLKSDLRNKHEWPFIGYNHLDFNKFKQRDLNEQQKDGTLTLYFICILWTKWTKLCPSIRITYHLNHMTYL
jgi:hypothetical protein